MDPRSAEGATWTSDDTPEPANEGGSKQIKTRAVGQERTKAEFAGEDEADAGVEVLKDFFRYGGDTEEVHGTIDDAEAG